MARKPVLTLTRTDRPAPKVHLRTLPWLFIEPKPGSKQAFLQYTGEELAMHHTSECAGRVDFEGETLFEVRNRYYEVEFPDAAMTLTLYVKVSDDAFEARVWQQHYPGGSAEWLRTDDVYPRRLAPLRRFADEHFEEIEPTLYVLDSCGERQIECIRQLDATPQSLKELLIDLDGRLRLLRQYRAAEGGDLQVGDWRYAPLYDEVPDDLVFAVWTH